MACKSRAAISTDRSSAPSASSPIRSPIGHGAKLYRTGDLARRVPTAGWSSSVATISRSRSRATASNWATSNPCCSNTRASARPWSSLASMAPATPDWWPISASEAEAGITIRQLRQHLLAGLPSYMVPAYFVAMESFPSTANGKLDRNALPEPEAGREGLAVAFEPPANRREQRICAEFSAALGVAIGRSARQFLRPRRQFAAGPAAAGAAAEDRGKDPAGAGDFREPDARGTRAGDRGRHIGGAANSLACRARIAPSRWPPSGSPARRADRSTSRSRSSRMAGRFPGADDVEAFWRNLCEGRDTISVFEPERARPRGCQRGSRRPALRARARRHRRRRPVRRAFFGITRAKPS